MAAESMRTSRVVVLALVVGSFFVAQEVFVDMAEGKSLNLGPRAVVVLCFWLSWAMLSPLVRRAVRPRPILAHLCLALGLAFVQTGIALTLQSIIRAIETHANVITVVRGHVHGVPYVWGMSTSVVFYAVVVMVYTALRFRDELTQAKLDTLRSQLRPHFLFNTLNAISVFVIEDADKAQQMLLRLSTLLRRSLDEEAHEVPLEQELEFVNDYLDIQRGRFGDQLIVEQRIDPNVRNVQVPVFLLQPLLENAIEHGTFEDKPTTVTLAAHRVDGMLHITLADDGPGVRDGAREGIGLMNTRARLRHLYGPRATVSLGPAGPGARVEIQIPVS
jgi:two-component system, LytTR family, sensor kinase